MTAIEMDTPPGPTRRARRRVGATPLGVGVAGLWLTVIVLLPLAAITAKSFDDGWSGFVDAITAEAAVGAIRVTVLVSIVVAIVNVVMGTVIAWVLVRDDFPARGSSTHSSISPSRCRPSSQPGAAVPLRPNSPIDIQINATKPALVVALAFVTLPFVVRQVQRCSSRSTARSRRPRRRSVRPTGPSGGGSSCRRSRRRSSPAPDWPSPARSGSSARSSSSAATSRTTPRSPRSTSSSSSKSTPRSTPLRCRWSCCSSRSWSCWSCGSSVDAPPS